MNGIYASSRGQMKFIMRAPTCKYADSKSGFNDMVGIEIRYRQGNLAVFFIGVIEGVEVVSRSGMEMNVRSPVLSYRHPEQCPALSCHSGIRHSCESAENCPDTLFSRHLTLSLLPECKEDFSLCSK